MFVTCKQYAILISNTKLTYLILAIVKHVLKKNHLVFLTINYK